MQGNISLIQNSVFEGLRSRPAEEMFEWRGESIDTQDFLRVDRFLPFVLSMCLVRGINANLGAIATLHLIDDVEASFGCLLVGVEPKPSIGLLGFGLHVEKCVRAAAVDLAQEHLAMQLLFRRSLGRLPNNSYLVDDTIIRFMHTNGASSAYPEPNIFENKNSGNKYFLRGFR